MVNIRIRRSWAYSSHKTIRCVFRNYWRSSWLLENNRINRIRDVCWIYFFPVFSDNNLKSAIWALRLIRKPCNSAKSEKSKKARCKLCYEFIWSLWQRLLPKQCFVSVLRLSIMSSDIAIFPLVLDGHFRVNFRLSALLCGRFRNWLFLVMNECVTIYSNNFKVVCCSFFQNVCTVTPFRKNRWIFLLFFGAGISPIAFLFLGLVCISFSLTICSKSRGIFKRAHIFPD